MIQPSQNKIQTHRTDINLRNYLQWQLNYFSVFPKICSQNGNQYSKGHWKKISYFVSGLQGRGFVENQNLDWDEIGETLLEIDIIPMHRTSTNGKQYQNIATLLLQRLQAIPIKNILVLGKVNSTLSLLQKLGFIKNTVGNVISSGAGANDAINMITSEKYRVFCRNSFSSHGTGNSSQDIHSCGQIISQHLI